MNTETTVTANLHASESVWSLEQFFKASSPPLRVYFGTGQLSLLCSALHNEFLVLKFASMFVS